MLSELGPLYFFYLFIVRKKVPLAKIVKRNIIDIIIQQNRYKLKSIKIWINKYKFPDI